jgi:hypothetical protein
VRRMSSQVQMTIIVSFHFVLSKNRMAHKNLGAPCTFPPKFPLRILQFGLSCPYSFHSHNFRSRWVVVLRSIRNASVRLRTGCWTSSRAPMPRRRLLGLMLVFPCAHEYFVVMVLEDG